MLKMSVGEDTTFAVVFLNSSTWLPRHLSSGTHEKKNKLLFKDFFYSLQVNYICLCDPSVPTHRDAPEILPHHS